MKGVVVMVSIFISGMSLSKSPDIDPFIGLIPVPRHVTLLEGGISFTSYSKIVSDLPEEYKFILLQIQQQFQHLMKETIGLESPEGSRTFKLPKKLQDFTIEEFRRPHFEREGYFLWVDQDGVCMQAPSMRGLFYATRTFFQLFLEAGGVFWIPRCEIIDYPSLEIRGVSDENARGQAGSINSLKRYVEILSSFKINMLQMNLEDMFLSKKHPKASDEERGCYSHDEIQELVNHAAKYFVDVCPIQNTCSHMDNLFILPSYSEIAEFHHASTCFDISNPKSLVYIKDLVEEEINAWSGSFHFHIGCDESFDVGKGRSASYVNEKGGKGFAYLEYYSKVYQIVKECLETRHSRGNFRIYMYHDILHKYEEILEHLPKENLIVDYWNYSPKKRYRKLKKIVDAGFNFVVTPSAMDWTRFYPSETKAEMNLVNIAKYASQYAEKKGKRKNFLGMISASWGDHLNPNLRDTRLYNYVLCGDVAWNLDVWKSFSKRTSQELRLPQFRCAFARQFLHIDPGKFIQVQDALRSIEDNNRLKLRLGSTFAFANLFIHPYQWRPRVNTRNFPQIIKEMERVVATCEDLKTSAGGNSFFLDHLIISASLFRLYAKKIINSRKIMAKKFEKYSPRKVETILPEIIQIRDEFQAMKGEYARVWRISCKEVGLAVHLQKFCWMVRFYNEMIAAFQNGTQKTANPNIPSEYIYFYPKREPRCPSYFRKSFQVTELPIKAFIQCVPFQYAEIYVNGNFVGEVERRYTISYMHNVHGIRFFDITKELHIGDNNIAVKVISYNGGWPMVNFYGEIYTNHGLDKMIYSDKSWFGIAGPSPPSDWQTCGLDIKTWKHVDTFGKPPVGMGALYYPDFEQGIVSHHTKNLGRAAEILPRTRIAFGWLLRLIAKLINRYQLYS
ncbi:MAG: glycoside hydrolase family protein [Promethearchaeota archaeon CR_4]|nr:MAG: glycoside hydrolase family protein [Candidatus Lokiarchaeota archaeon CR_4]